MGVPVLLQRGEAEHLLSGGDTQLAVNVFVVVFQRVGGDSQLLGDLLGVVAGQIQLIDLMLRGSQGTKIAEEEFIFLQNDLPVLGSGELLQFSLHQIQLPQSRFVIPLGLGGVVRVDHLLRLVQDIGGGADVGDDLNGFPAGGGVTVVQTDAAVNGGSCQRVPNSLESRILQLQFPCPVKESVIWQSIPHALMQRPS